MINLKIWRINEETISIEVVTGDGGYIVFQKNKIEIYDNDCLRCVIPIDNIGSINLEELKEDG